MVTVSHKKGLKFIAFLMYMYVFFLQNMCGPRWVQFLLYVMFVYMYTCRCLQISGECGDNIISNKQIKD